MRGLSYQKLNTVLIQNFSYDRNKNLTINNHDINGKIDNWSGQSANTAIGYCRQMVVATKVAFQKSVS